MSRIITKHGHGHGGHSGGSDPSHIADGHLTDHKEYRELNFKAINQFMIGLAATVAISYLSMYGIMWVFESEFEKNDPAPSPVTSTAWPTPTPDVQAAPHVDLTLMQWQDKALLDSGVAGTIPISQAMQDVVSEGLPWQAAAEASSTTEMQTPATETETEELEAGE